MLKRPLIAGSKGNMGRRYAAILKHLGVSYLGIDKGDRLPKGFDSIIIATPTENHLQDILVSMQLGKPILCEKPFSKNVGEVLRLCERAVDTDYPLSMINQYAYLPDGPGGLTEYNNWNHGKDSLPWDCINIIGQAEGEVLLGEDSPIWRCVLNGREQVLCDMDYAYIAMMQSWLSGETSNIPYIRHAHQKVQEYICKSSS